ncbi:MAG: hypothetical protein OZ917_05320 [Candidatus Brocadiaceae bacterium]|nr:hypothetical protein [Candidatus Brocadiaceae bacterium]
MVHYTCDMCGRPLLANEDIRYVVKIEVYTACDAMEMDDDEAMEEEMWEMEENNDQGEKSSLEESFEDGEYKTFRFDLCTKCHKKYLHDPLFLKSWNRTRFSEN